VAAVVAAQVVVIRRTGGPEVLELERREIGPPGPDEVLLQHRAIGLNFIDTYHRSGLYPLPSLPHGIGVEAAGVVLELGSGVADLERGQRVAYATGSPGAYATHRLVPRRHLVPIPDGVSDEAAAAVLLKGMTVEYLVRRTYAVQAGQYVLWHAAAGGVGLIACQWLRHIGAHMIGTVGTKQKAELALRHGCSTTVSYAEEDVSARVRELTSGALVPVVYDSVGKATFASSLASLAPRGLLVSFGNASGKPDPVDVLDLASHGSLYLTRPVLAHYTNERAELEASAAQVFGLVKQGVLCPIVGQRFSLGEVRRAHEALQARHTFGSTVISLE
jgi:NADPH2:quinone reductase